MIEMRYLIMCIFLLSVQTGQARQGLTLEECHQKAEELSPLYSQKDVNELINDLQVQNLTTDNYPGIFLQGQFTYQSDVFTLPQAAPGFETPVVPKDQYKISVDLQQKIYDGRKTRYQVNLQEIEHQADNQQVEVNLFRLKGIVNKLFFTAFTLQENERLFKVLKKDLLQKKKEIRSKVEHGVLLPEMVTSLDKEIIKMEQSLIEVTAKKLAVLKMLSKWVGVRIDSTSQLEKPTLDHFTTEAVLQRPEQELFRLQQQRLEANKDVVQTFRHPQLFAFASLGIGNPNPYNFFETEPSAFYLLGAKVSWQIWDWKNISRQKEVLELEKNKIQLQKENFERNLSIDLEDEIAEISLLEEMILKDQLILELQKKIIRQAFSRLSNGVISSTEYSAELNNLVQAELNLQLREISLLQTKINYLTESGTF